MKNLLKRFGETLKYSAAARIVTAGAAGALVFTGIRFGRAAVVRRALSNRSGEGYIDTAIKILIAVVLGALLLAGLYALFGETVLPTLVQRIKDMFNYTG
jgi:hypothetical protein